MVQTGVQLLTGFLLTLPFQSVFAQLATFERVVYLVTVGCAISATGFLVAPVSLHRFLFRRHQRKQMVTAAHHLALTGILLLACAIIGVVLLTFGVVEGDTPGIIAAGVSAVLLLTLWALLPLRLRKQRPDDQRHPSRPSG